MRSKMKASELDVTVKHFETSIDRATGKASFTLDLWVENDKFAMFSEGMIIDGREFASGACALCDDSTYWFDKVNAKSVQGEELLRYPSREWDFTGCDAEFAEFVRDLEFYLNNRGLNSIKSKVLEAIADTLVAKFC